PQDRGLDPPGDRRDRRAGPVLGRSAGARDLEARARAGRDVARRASVRRRGDRDRLRGDLVGGRLRRHGRVHRLVRAGSRRQLHRQAERCGRAELRSQLGRIVGGSGLDFVNDYAEQRGLVPIAPVRRVTAVRRSHGRIADLCDPESDWRVSVDEAIDDIDRGRVTYYIEPTPDADRNVIFVRRVLTTAPDEIRENNLDDLPQQAHHDGLPPSAGFWRHVTSVERDEDGETVFLNNDDEGWSVPRAVAWLEVSTETAAYYIQRTPPTERKELLASAHL